MRTCVVVPFFDHGPFVGRVLARLDDTGLPVIVVDDGSSALHREALDAALSGRPHVSAVRLPENRGKGAAVTAGVLRASADGFTHAIQVDADDQHDVSDVPRFLDAARADPSALVLGDPVFDRDVPWERYYFRRLSTWLVWAHCGSRVVRDALCGFRLYPVAPTAAALRRRVIDPRMGFDTEILVRLVRAGVPVRHVPTRVAYRPGGVSHFRYVRDNLAIARMHLLLASERLRRPPEWHEKREAGTDGALSLLHRLHLLLGPGVLGAVAWPAAVFYFAADSAARRASLCYLRRVRPGLGPARLAWESVRHFRSFAGSVIDSFRAWDDSLGAPGVTLVGRDVIYPRLDAGRGGLVLSAHFGSLETCRALYRDKPSLVVRPLMYLKNGRRFRDFLARVNPDAAASIVHVDAVNPATVLALRDAVARGEFVAVLADRVVPGSADRTVTVELLGGEVTLPEGPFLLASLLGCDVLTLFCYRDDGGSFVVEWKELRTAEGPSGRRRRRDEIEGLARSYAASVEDVCRRAPLAWFNFYDYWSEGDAAGRGSPTRRRLTAGDRPPDPGPDGAVP